MKDWLALRRKLTPTTSYGATRALETRAGIRMVISCVEWKFRIVPEYLLE